MTKIMLSQETAEQIHDVVYNVIKNFVPAIMKDPDPCQAKKNVHWRIC